MGTEVHTMEGFLMWSGEEGGHTWGYDELYLVFALFCCVAASPQQTITELDINNFTLTNWLWTLWY